MKLTLGEVKIMKSKVFSVAVFLILSTSLLKAESFRQSVPVAQSNVYSLSPAEPTCCYSERRIWKKTSTQSGWSVNPNQFNPMGFAQRERYRSMQPAPLPRDRRELNPWSVTNQNYSAHYERRNQNRAQGSNAEYFQPGGYRYPVAAGGYNELDYVPDALTGYGDPFLYGLAYPGYAPLGYATPWGGGPYLPGAGLYPPMYGPYGW